MGNEDTKKEERQPKQLDLFSVDESGNFVPIGVKDAGGADGKSPAQEESPSSCETSVIKRQETDLTLAGRIVAGMAQSVRREGITDDEARFAVETVTRQVDERVRIGQCSTALFNVVHSQFFDSYIAGNIDAEFLSPVNIQRLKEMNPLQLATLKEKLGRERDRIIAQNWEFLKNPSLITSNLAKSKLKVEVESSGITHITPSNRESIRNIVDAILTWWNSSEEEDNGVKTEDV